MASGRLSDLAAVATCRSSCLPRACGAGAECVARPSSFPSPAVKAWTSPGQSPVVTLAAPHLSGFPILSASPSVAFLRDSMSTHPHGPPSPWATPLPQTSTASPGHRAHQGPSPPCIPARPADGADAEPLGVGLWVLRCSRATGMARMLVRGPRRHTTEAGFLSWHLWLQGHASCSVPRDPILILPEGSAVSRIAAPDVTRLGTSRQTG